MDSEQKSVAYIIGNTFEALTQLPNVYTVNQFFLALLRNSLPKHRAWIVGQGIHISVQEILSLCEKSHPKLHFHFCSLATNEKEACPESHKFLAQENEMILKKIDV